MGFFSWIIFIVIILPAFIGLAISTLKGIARVPDDHPFFSPIGITIELCIAAILIIWSFIDISNGIFTSLKTVCLFGIKILVGSELTIGGLRRLIIKLYHNYWDNKIKNALDGQLGKNIKKYLHNNSYEYIVYNDRIVFDKDGNQWHLKFADLGYGDIPASNADSVCEWICQNIVITPEAYRIEREHEEQTDYSFYTSGTPDSYSVTKNYSGGYDVEHYSGSSGEFGTKTVTVSFKLTRKPYMQAKSQPTLKKW